MGAVLILRSGVLGVEALDGDIGAIIDNSSKCGNGELRWIGDRFCSYISSIDVNGDLIISAKLRNMLSFSFKIVSTSISK